MTQRVVPVTGASRGIGAATVLRLCPPAPASVTGTTLTVDGGRLAGSPAGRRRP